MYFEWPPTPELSHVDIDGHGEGEGLFLGQVPLLSRQQVKPCQRQELHDVAHQVALAVVEVGLGGEGPA